MKAFEATPVLPRGKVVLSICAGLVACGLGWVLVYCREPSSQGKSLRYWADQYGSNHWGGISAKRGIADKEAASAILAFGTNAIPFYVDMIRAKESPIKVKLRSIIPRKWHDRLHLRDGMSQTHRTGSYGLAALGTNAAPAVPLLMDIIRHDSDEDSRYCAAFALRTLEIGGDPAIPFLLECLSNKTMTIRDEAVLALGYLHERPEAVVPALTEFLKTRNIPESFDKYDAIQALGNFRTNAQSAVPVLTSLLESSNPNIREAVSNYLPMIDRELASRLNMVQRSYAPPTPPTQ